MQWRVTKAELNFVITLLRRIDIIHVTANIYKVRHAFIIFILSS